MGRTRQGRLIHVALASTIVVMVLNVVLIPAMASTPARPEKVLYSFAGPNGAGPLSGVTVGSDGVLYGTTVFGGRFGGGCVFSLTPAGSGYTERILFSFHGSNGAKPAGNVVVGAHRTLFGATSIGGSHNAGTVFELVPRGNGYTEKVLYDFTGMTDGQEPIGTPVLGVGGDIFGVTQFGGTFGQGVVYSVAPSPTGYSEQVLHSFAGDAGQPQAGLTKASDGTLYGTLYGFSEVNPDGTVFRLQLKRTGDVYSDLYDFQGGTDGTNPYAVLTVDDHTGVIYGTTEYGGGVGSYGTVFSLTPSGGGYQEEVLHRFTDDSAGVLPQSPLLRTANGDLIGTADIAGVGCSGIGCGTVYELRPVGSDYMFRVVYRFTGPPDGAEPQLSGVVAGPGREIFGTTRSGGTSTTCSDGGPGGVLGCGTVYESST